MRRFQLIDKSSLMVTLTLCVLGIIFIRSATLNGGDSNLWLKQCVWVVAGCCGYFFLAMRDYKQLLTHATLIYLASIAALGAVLIFGVEINGARSWFRLPGFSIQPSEFTKITMVLVVTKYFSRFQEHHSSLLQFLGSSILIAIPFGLIVFQPDLGTALVYLPFFLIPNFLAGNKESIWVTALGSVSVVLLMVAVVYKPDYVFFMQDYQKKRIVAFLNQEDDVSGKGYQVHQSKITIGQGGLLGLGLGKGEQTKTGFLPEQHTDFILAVAAEETGFLGIAIIFGLFLWLFIRAFITALEASDAMGSMLVMLVIGTLCTQMLFNASMLIGLTPTTGIPCPLISYGGSSMLTTMCLLGLVQSVRAHRFVNH